MGRGYMKRAPTEADAERRSPGVGHALGLGELTLLPNRQLDMVAKSAVTIGDLGAPATKCGPLTSQLAQGARWG